jgi:hypothetical protein
MPEGVDRLAPEAAASYRHCCKQIEIVTAGSSTRLRGLGDRVGALYLAALHESAETPDGRKRWVEFLSALALFIRRAASRGLGGDIGRLQALSEFRQIVYENVDLSQSS